MVLDILLTEPTRRRARERIYRGRYNLFEMSDNEVYRMFRFSPEVILELVTILQDDISSPTHRGQAVQPLVKVVATLHFLASGSFQRTGGVVAGMSQSSMSRCVHQVIPAILRRMGTQFIKPTTADLRQKAISDFYEIARFPRTVGAIDCTHVALRPPPAPRAYLLQQEALAFDKCAGDCGCTWPHMACPCQTPRVKP